MISVSFNKKLYNREAIEKAAQIYKDWADFKIDDFKEEIKVCIDFKDENNEEYIKDEFCNYVLALMGEIKLSVL